MYLMKGMAALALCAVAVSCNRLEFSGQPEVSKEDAIANAELQLGAAIDPNQDWNMTADATANVTVNETFGETYTVKIYANNPLADEVAYVLKQGEVQNGKTFTTSFTYPSGNRSVIVGITDSKGYTFYRAGKVENGVLNVTFGDTSAAPHRSMAAPACPGIDQPYTEAWVADYLTTAKEPDNTNVWDNYDNSTYGTNYGEGGVNSIDWNDAQQVKDRQYFFGDDGNTDTWEQRLAWALINHPTWVIYTADETYVTNYKIARTWNGHIDVAGSEGSQNPGSERTIVVTGTWNLTEDQRIGSLGKVIVADGGTINISEGVTLSMVNQSRLVVLHGGRITGTGNIAVTNGNADGFENYNGGTIELTGSGTFNNNFGKFFNYGTVKVANYASGGSGEGVMTNGFFNHGLVVIDNANDVICRNARVYNACQWYVKGDMQVYIIEEVQGASFIVDGELRCNCGNDGSNDPTYVGLQAGAYVECGTLYNNGTSWSGPTEGGYAVLKMGQITHLNWEQAGPAAGGYFANNICVELTDGTNCPTGNGWQTWTAHYKFFNIVANAFNNGETEPQGNGHVTEVVAGTTELIPASEGFVKGSAGCTPGYSGDVPEIEEPNSIWSYAFEDTAVGDYDLNDVVLKAQENGDNIELKLVAAGATLNLEIRLYDYDENGDNDYGNDHIVLKDAEGNTEIHDILGVTKGTMVNTGGNSANAQPYTFTIPKSQYDASKLRLAIYAVSQDHEVRLSGSGDTPHGVMIPYDWRWPTERTRVTIAYNKKDAPEAETDQSFTTFMSNKGKAELWYKYPTKSTMIK